MSLKRTFPSAFQEGLPISSGGYESGGSSALRHELVGGAKLPNTRTSCLHESSRFCRASPAPTSGHWGLLMSSMKLLRIWQISAVLSGLLAVGLIVVSIAYAPRALWVGAQGFLKYDYEEAAFHGMAAQRVVKLPRGTPLIAAGVVPGDLIVDPPRGVMTIGETVTLRVAHNTKLRTISVAAVSNERYANPTAVVLFLATASLLVALAILITTRRRGDLSALVIAVGSCLAAISLVPNTLPPHRLVGLLDLSYEWLGMLFFPFMSYAALMFDGGYRSSLRRWILCSIVCFCGAWAACVFINAPYYLGEVWFPPSWMNGMRTAFRLAAVTLCLAAFVDTWRHVDAGSRAKLRWLFTSAGLVFFTFILSVAHGVGLFGFTQAVQIRIDVAAGALLSSAAIVLTYAVLRHRVIDLGFVIGRALVFTIVTGSLLVCFGVAEWLTAQFIHFEAREKNVMLEGAIALGIYLSFHRVRHWVERAVERVFFNTWHLKEAALKHFLARPPHFVEPDSLADAFLEAINAFTSGAGSALYQRDEAGHFVMERSTLVGLPAMLEAETGLIVELEKFRLPVHLGVGVSMPPVAMAFPLLRRSELFGALVVGAKLGGEAYRPDEVDNLAHAAQQLGLDLHALRVEQLERRARELEQENARLREQLQSLFRNRPQDATSLGLLDYTVDGVASDPASP